MSSFRLPFDLIVATLLLVTSGVGAVAVYMMKAYPSKPPTGLFQGLREGDFEYVLTHKGGCVGEVSYSFTPVEEVYRIKVKGAIRTIFAGQMAPIVFDSEINFSRLGQLSDTVAHLTVKNQSFQFATTGISPIVAIFKGAGIRREFSIPGPLEISKNKDDSWRVHLETLQPQLAGLSLADQPLVREHGIAVSDKASAVCLQQGSYDLSPLTTVAQALGGILPGGTR